MPKKALKECPPGKIRNPATRRCISDPALKSKKSKNKKKSARLPKAKDCPDGWVINPKTGRCIKDCPRNEKTGKCIPIAKRKSSSPKPAKRKSSSPKPAKRKSSSPKPSKRKSSSQKPAKRKLSSPKPVKRKSSSPKPAKRKSSSPKPVKRKSKDTKRVLILCHPKKVTGSFKPLILNNHHYGELGIFKSIFEDYNLEGNPIFDTIDILEGGTYQDNVFSDKFISEHNEQYDLVMVPDCGGPWYEYQTNRIYMGRNSDGMPYYHNRSQGEINFNGSLLIDLCLNLLKLLKPGGLIFFAKFLYDEKGREIQIGKNKYKDLAHAVNDRLNREGFISNIKETKKGITRIGQYIIAQKPE